MRFYLCLLKCLVYCEVQNSMAMRMKQNIRKLAYIFNATLVIAFLIHISLIGYNIKHPDVPSVRVDSRDLMDLNRFPLSFKLCVKEHNKIKDRYRKYGYNNVNSFFQGRKRYFAGKWFGWAGHHGSGNETLGPVEGSTVLKI